MGSDFRSVGGAAPCTPRAFIGQAGCGGLQPAANPFCSAHVQPDSRPAAAEPGGMQQCPPPTSGESLAGASPQTKQPAERWYTVLRALQAAPCGSQSEAAAEQQPLDVAGVLRTALQAVRGDEQWNCSGIPELLTRALETAEKGLTSSARKAAVGLLDFHFLVEKYRSVVSRSSTSSASADSAGEGRERRGARRLQSRVG